MAYDNRSVSPLKIKGSPYKKDTGKIVGENYTSYARRTMSKAEFAVWDGYLDGPKSHRRTKVWNGEKWVKASEYSKKPGFKQDQETGDTKKDEKKADFLKKIQMGKNIKMG